MKTICNQFSDLFISPFSPKGKFDQHASSSEQKQTVEFDSNEWNRKNSIVTNESEEETSLSSLSTDQSVLQAGSFVKIYINETGNILTEEQDADADQTSTTNRIRTAPVRENKPRVDDSVANGRKRFSKRTKVKGVSEGKVTLVNFITFESNLLLIHLNVRKTSSWLP